MILKRRNFINSYSVLFFFVINLIFLGTVIESTNVQPNNNQIKTKNINLVNNLKLDHLVNYPSINPLTIDGNANFTNYGIFSGTGIQSDPYELANKTIILGYNVGISIINTDAYFILRNIEVYGNKSDFHVGFKLFNVSNGYLLNTSAIQTGTGYIVGGGSHDNHFELNTAWDSYGMGFTVEQSNFNLFEYNIADQNDDIGFNFFDSSNNTLNDNTAVDNIHHGFYFWYGSNNTIYRNIAHRNANGIVLWEASNYNFLSDNDAKENQYSGYVFWNNIYNHLEYNNAENNYGDGFTIYYNANYSTFLFNYASYNLNQGFYLENSSSNTFSSNSASLNDEYGFYITDGSNYNYFSDNFVFANGYDGIYLFNSIYNQFQNNDISYNEQSGIFVDSSNYNYFGQNSITENFANGISLLGNYNTFINNNISINDGTGLELISVASDNNISMNIIMYNRAIALSLDSATNNNIISQNDIVGTEYYGIAEDNGAGNVFTKNFWYGCKIYTDMYNIGGIALNYDLDPVSVPYINSPSYHPALCFVDVPNDIEIYVGDELVVMKWMTNSFYGGEYEIYVDSSLIASDSFTPIEDILLDISSLQLSPGNYEIYVYIYDDYTEAEHYVYVSVLEQDTKSSDSSSSKTDLSETRSSEVIITTTPSWTSVIALLSFLSLILIRKKRY